MKPMLPWPERIALDHHRLHVVVERFERHTAEELERSNVATNQRLDALIEYILDVTRPAKPQRGNKGRQDLSRKLDPVDLQLLPRRGLEAHQRIGLLNGLEHAHVPAYQPIAARKSLLANLACQNRRRNPMRLRRLHPLLKVTLKRIELRSLRRPRPVLRRPTLGQIPAHRIHRHAHLDRDLAKRSALPSQNSNLHTPLPFDHRRFPASAKKQPFS